MHPGGVPGARGTPRALPVGQMRQDALELEPDLEDEIEGSGGQQDSPAEPLSAEDVDLFAALDEALAEIAAENRAVVREKATPSWESVELRPNWDTLYQQAAKSFICTKEVPRTAPRSTGFGQRVLAKDENLEQLLKKSLKRATLSLDRRRRSG